MNQVLRSVMMLGALMVGLATSGCAASTPPEPDDTQAAAAPLSGNVCDQFCQSQGGPNYLLLSAGSESQCVARGGDWYTADQGYGGPPPGCCCSCRRPGFCL